MIGMSVGVAVGSVSDMFSVSTLTILLFSSWMMHGSVFSLIGVLMLLPPVVDDRSDIISPGTILAQTNIAVTQ